MSEICHFSFNLSAWRVVCSKQLTEQDWILGEEHWFNNEANWVDYQPKLTFLSPLKRRRLSDSARLFFDVAYSFSKEYANLPVVYASLNSEINRSFPLLNNLLKEGEISPTSFSLSVHNALVGQWSEQCRITQEITALTALRDNLEIALMEAFTLLNEGQSKVLVVVAETPLYKKYNVQPIKRQPFAYALAMIVEKGTQYQLSLHHTKTEIVPQVSTDNALIWVQSQYLHQTHWQTPSTKGYWQWVKN